LQIFLRTSFEVMFNASRIASHNFFFLCDHYNVVSLLSQNFCPVTYWLTNFVISFFVDRYLTSRNLCSCSQATRSAQLQIFPV